MEYVIVFRHAVHEDKWKVIADHPFHNRADADAECARLNDDYDRERDLPGPTWIYRVASIEV